MRIDVHAHLWTSEYLDLIESRGREGTEVHRDVGAGATGAELAARFELMDSAIIRIMETGFELGTDGPKVILAGVDDTEPSLRAAAYAWGFARRQGPTWSSSTWSPRAPLAPSPRAAPP